MAGSRKLGRTSDHRKAMLRAMVTYLFENGRIETTVTRAKEVRAVAEKMVTLGKSDDLHAKRQIFAFVTKEDVAKKLIDDIAPRYIQRQGGYTRIVRTGVRRLISGVIGSSVVGSVIGRIAGIAGGIVPAAGSQHGQQHHSGQQHCRDLFHNTILLSLSPLPEMYDIHIIYEYIFSFNQRAAQRCLCYIQFIL